MPKLTRLIGTTLGGTAAGPAGALLGGLAAAGLECLFPAGGMVQQTTGDFAIDAIRNLGQRMQPGLPDSINADLQRAFHAALVPALYDLGGRPCFPQPWQARRDVPEELPFFHQPQAAHRRQQDDPLARQACELLHTLHSTVCNTAMVMPMYARTACSNPGMQCLHLHPIRGIIRPCHGGTA